MGNVLLEVLNEVLEDLTKRMAETEKIIGKAEEDLKNAREVAEGLEKDRQSKADKDELLHKKIDVLRDYITELGKCPTALTEKVTKLNLEKMHVSHARVSAEEAMGRAYTHFQSKDDDLNILRGDYEALKRNWCEVSALISQKHGNDNNK